jgi:hypothetical protein
MKYTRLLAKGTLYAVLACAELMAFAAPSRGDGCAGDQFWIISTRHIDEAPCHAIPRHVKVHRFEDSCWRRSSFEEFLAAHDPAAVTFFYIHGNRYEADEALERGWLIYRYLRHDGGPRVPLRFVTWSWPSQPTPGIVRDVRLKAERTDLEGLYLGTVISRLPPDAMVSLQGFSFGTRVISGSLQKTAGCPPSFLRRGYRCARC